MTTKTITTTISVSRTHFNDSDDQVRIRIEDANSGIQIISLDLDMSAFSRTIFGEHGVSGKASVCLSENIGKVRKTEKRSKKLDDTFTGSRYSREDMSRWLESTFDDEEGWKCSSYLGAQSSISYDGGDIILNFFVYKYIDPEES